MAKMQTKDALFCHFTIMENHVLSNRLCACFDMKILVCAKQGSAQESSVNFSITISLKSETTISSKLLVMKSLKTTQPIKMTQSMNMNVTCAKKYTLVKNHSKTAVTIKTVHLKNEQIQLSI